METPQHILVKIAMNHAMAVSFQIKDAFYAIPRAAFSEK